ncbi:extensin family protein [Vannielia sp.]|uniref:extensin-like domain-containing protein n=1 Tax=Vannielia sp. TaxID=2813045 RepID=UPI002613E202|nr:extensin family protein [Vannielia sp.]MDF1872868.1 extensin family protein [Vannielia sp.]
MIRAALVLLLTAAPALAKGPDASLRPLPRPVETPDTKEKTVISSSGGSTIAPLTATGLVRGPDLPPTRPPARPAQPKAPVTPDDAARVPVFGAPTLAAFTPRAKPPAALPQFTATTIAFNTGAPRAQARPSYIARLVKEQATLTEVRFGRKDSVCGINAIKGTAGKTFGKPNSGCGIANPVKVTSIQGITLTQTTTVDCQTAKALNSWVSKGLKPAIGSKGGGVKQIKVVAHYACRNRNNAKTGRLSEHAKGRAVDISGIVLRDGTYVSVLKGWGSKAWSAALKKMHKQACGPFGTVLGPNANRFHRDHFHFDTARYRSGSYCR